MIEEMEVGDYIIADGDVVKITRYEVELQGKTALVDGKNPNITIDDEVLKASGFVKINDSAAYKCILKDDAGNVKYTVIFNPDTYVCEISRSIDMRPDFIQEIRVLSELQDFIRHKTGKELPIKIEELAAIFK